MSSYSFLALITELLNASVFIPGTSVGLGFSLSGPTGSGVRIVAFNGAADRFCVIVANFILKMPSTPF